MDTARQDELYKSAAAEFGAALERLARGYEADADKRRDVLQDIHFALWRSFRLFNSQCSLRTWVYRVAHNTATSHILKARRRLDSTWVDLDDEIPANTDNAEDSLHHQQTIMRLLALIHRLRPQDRQIILLYLEGMDAAAVAEITGLNTAHIATKIHRIKALLSRQFHQESFRDR